MKSLIAFMRLVLDELGDWCSTSTTRDWQTVTRRLEHEGVSFFTMTLSDFGKGFEKSLDLGSVAHDRFPGFAWTGGLPRFMGGFLEQVFDRKTGRLLDDPSVTAIWAIRQFSLMCAKIELPVSERRREAAMVRFVECETELRVSYTQLPQMKEEQYDRVGRLLWADLFSAVDGEIFHNGVRPQHGPGSTADRITGNRKWEQCSWPDRVNREFPYWDYLYTPWRSEESFPQNEPPRLVEPGAETPVRVVAVPKTQRTPRIIAMEPVAMQYVQQGILKLMKQEFRRNDNASNFVKSDSQVPNQLSAREGSYTRLLATLDLSEASDRVHYQHVLTLLRNHPHLRRAVDASRSRKADVLGHGVLRLAKFASMGSALCFPFEALVFATIVFVGIEDVLNRQLTKEDIESFYGRVRVYGDDIIVPVEYVQSVISSLEAFGLKVNTNKSFWTGGFRESCGGDYYDGYDVHVVRIRSEFPESRKQADEVQSTVALRNQLYELGMDRPVKFLDDLISRVIPFPEIESLNSPLLGRLTSTPVLGKRVDPDLQHPLVKGVVAVPDIPDSHLDGNGALMKFLLKESEDPYDEEHLARAGRSRSSALKTRWARPF